MEFCNLQEKDGVHGLSYCKALSEKRTYWETAQEFVLDSCLSTPLVSLFLAARLAEAARKQSTQRCPFRLRSCDNLDSLV